ncbi:MAG TPA: dihydroxyacetone kinase subunit DhaL [Euzebya sp.]|nr:dihydroxyacetone kinase subunit DhaL [Euzebya sp.]
MVAPVVAQAIDVGSLVVWFRRFAAAIEVHADDLSSLDAAIGDADHGTNMRRGCQAVVAALDADRPSDVTGFGKTVGMRLISAVGGASGPLYGSFFLAFGTAGGGASTLTTTQLAACWQAGADSVASRGKAVLSDKTMLDAMLPAVDALQDGATSGQPIAEVLARAVVAAEEGMRATIPMTARKGRASYLGERSAGHQDPGATSTWLLVRSAAEALRGEGS